MISMDLNYDDKCYDSFYRLQKVSQNGANSSAGYNGLSNSTDPSGNGDNYAYNGGVMIWSAGPDGTVDPTMPANKGANKDNVLSWK
jgi:hypothetical protein